MLCVGVAHVTLKSGEERVLLSALARRSNTNGFDCQKVWINPAEASRTGIKPGDQFRAFSDGGIMVLDLEAVSLTPFNDVL